MIYLDSCALVKLVVDESGSVALKQFLDGRREEMISSELAITEVVRSVRRSCHDSQRRLRVEPERLAELLDVAAVLLDEIDLMAIRRNRLVEAARFDGDPHVGSLDAIHLVCAERIGSVLAAFVTYDKRLAQAANERGLPVAQPV